MAHLYTLVSYRLVLYGIVLQSNNKSLASTTTVSEQNMMLCQLGVMLGVYRQFTHSY